MTQGLTERRERRERQYRIYWKLLWCALQGDTPHAFRFSGVRDPKNGAKMCADCTGSSMYLVHDGDLEGRISPWLHLRVWIACRRIRRQMVRGGTAPLAA